MSVKIVRNNKLFSYSMKKTLEDQVRGCTEIQVCGNTNDPIVEHFFDQVERICKKGATWNIEIKMSEDHFTPPTELSLNDIISKMVNLHQNADRRLEEISIMMHRQRKKA